MSEKQTQTEITTNNPLRSFVERKFNSARNIPRCILRDILFVLGLGGKEVRESIALHEAGHALTLVFNEIRLDAVRVYRMSHDTRAQICKLLGFPPSYYKYNSAGVTEKTCGGEYYRFFKAHPDRLAITDIAGIAAEPAHVKMLDEFIDEGTTCEWRDINHPCWYIWERFTAIHGVEPSKEQVSAVFRELLAIVKETFKDEKITKALRIIQQEVLKHKLKKRVNAKILSSLEKAGYTQTDLDEMRAKIFAINIDATIAKYASRATA